MERGGLCSPLPFAFSQNTWNTSTGWLESLSHVSLFLTRTCTHTQQRLPLTPGDQTPLDTLTDPHRDLLRTPLETRTSGDPLESRAPRDQSVEYGQEGDPEKTNIHLDNKLFQGSHCYISLCWVPVCSLRNFTSALVSD